MNDKAAPKFTCSRRGFLLGTATTAAGALLAACAPGSDVERVAAADVPVGGGTVVGQGGRINAVRDGVMICPDHNSHFDIETGDVVSGPSRQPAGTAKLGSEGQELIVGG